MAVSSLAPVAWISRDWEIEFLDPISVYFHHATPGLDPDVETSQNGEWGR